jgi:NAD(P)-dependent dehydrogenase (short-subunit alcohol dehydrogenase family)
MGERDRIMEIRGKAALLTGANRGLGRAFAEALLDAGAAKVYACARDPSMDRHPRLVPVRLDVTSSRDVSSVAATSVDVEILINNAGAMFNTSVLAAQLGGRAAP